MRKFFKKILFSFLVIGIFSSPFMVNATAYNLSAIANDDFELNSAPVDMVSSATITYSEYERLGSPKSFWQEKYAYGIKYSGYVHYQRKFKRKNKTYVSYSGKLYGNVAPAKVKFAK